MKASDVAEIVSARQNLMLSHEMGQTLIIVSGENANENYHRDFRTLQTYASGREHGCSDAASQASKYSFALLMEVPEGSRRDLIYEE